VIATSLIANRRAERRGEDAVTEAAPGPAVSSGPAAASDPVAPSDPVASSDPGGGPAAKAPSSETER
jgi:hypothetical protein